MIKKRKTTVFEQLNYLLITLTFMLGLTLNNPSAVAQCEVPDIGTFTSVNPNNRGEILELPPTHTFQKIIKSGEDFTGGTFSHTNADFTGYVPIEGSNTNGYLSINDEVRASEGGGGVAVLDINYEADTKLWEVDYGKNLNFGDVCGTARNCSGAVAPWGNVISSEESLRNDICIATGYKKYGWQVEIDPENKTVIGKHYAMGNFAHENAAILQQGGKTVVYQGADQSKGYLFKFVSYQQNDLSNGDLYVYKGPKTLGSGSWIKIKNQTIDDRNNTIQLAINVNATVFDFIEDVEINPKNGLVYFAVKKENRVYYLEDINPIGIGQVNFKGTYVGGDIKKQYPVKLSDGTTVDELWGDGNDNLAFDNEGNLWVLQDGSNDHIWLVRNGHTQARPKVEVFATTPFGSEPTGITFTPDNRFMFISIQHPYSDNTQFDFDAEGKPVRYDDDITLVVARKEHLGNSFDCCPSDIVIRANNTLKTLYESSETIETEVTASNAVDVLISNNETVDLKSAHIKLYEGFKVESGGCLNATIAPCE